MFEVAFIETRCDLVRKEALEKIGFWFEGLYNSTEDQDVSAHMREFGYRLLQDKRMKFSLDFGQTEDNLYKVFKKQYKYAHGQGYIFLRYGLGHHTMTGDQHNRRIRIRHRLIQISSFGNNQRRQQFLRAGRGARHIRVFFVESVAGTSVLHEDSGGSRLRRGNLSPEVIRLVGSRQIPFVGHGRRPFDLVTCRFRGGQAEQRQPHS